jgi:hypothetical protein
MGMDQSVTFAGAAVPTWPAVCDLLARHGFAAQVRMIDGELAFPDETPPETWRELRVGTPQGMVTLRREADRVVCVTWGNADATLVQAWNALAWAFAEAGGGRVVSAAGPLAAADFRHSADLPPSLRAGPR